MPDPTDAPVTRRPARRARRRAAAPALGVTVVAGLVLVAAVGVQGPPRFTGVRWMPHLGSPARVVPPSLPAASPVTPGPLATLRLGDGTHVDVPWGPVLLAVLALVVAVVVVAVWRRLRARPGRAMLVDDPAATASGGEQVVGPEPEAQPDPVTVLRGLRAAHAVLTEDRAPADAVVAAWVGLEEAADDAGVRRRGAETPTELAVRLVAATSADEEAARTLLAVYLRVRFGGHEATPDDVAVALACVTALEAAWREPAGRWRR